MPNIQHHLLFSSQKTIKKIEVGKFYFIHDESSTGHPGFIVRKDDEKNRYLVILTESDKINHKTKKSKGARHLIQLKHTTAKNIVRSYIKTRPLICKRKDIGIPLPDIKFHTVDMKIVEYVSRQKPRLSRSFKKRK